MRSYVPADASGVSGRTMTGTSVWFADLNEHSSKSKHFCVTRAGLARYSAASEIRSFLPQIGRCTSRRIGSCLFVSHRSVESSE
eukprot:COSAG06_NODE_67885_length_249_cov_97.393333_1_plen_83_part_11